MALEGRLVRDPDQLVIPERVRITIDGETAGPPPPLTIALHKPRGVVTTRRDPEGRRTVYDLLDNLDAHLVPVGRLDFATSGLLLLTNDTRLADWLTDPANAVPRVYLVSVRGCVEPDALTRLEHGIDQRGDMLSARSARLRKASGRESLVVVELVEGKNREVRRMMAAIGHEVTRLRRVQFGGLSVDGLAPGKWRRLSVAELEHAFPGAPLSRLRASQNER